MTETRPDFREVCQLIWGAEWRNHACDELGVSDRSIRRFAAGTLDPPPGVWQALRDIALQKHQYLQAAAIEIHEHVQSQQKAAS